MSMLKSTAVAFALTLGLASGAIAEDITHVQQLLSTKKCVGCDLTNAGLVMANLPGANLSQANLVSANLSQATLSGANLSGANLVGASLAGANLAGANLQGANLTGVDLRETYLVGADLTNAKLDHANIQAAIGLPTSVGTAEQFYGWAIAAGQQKRYELALQYFNQSLERQSDYAPAILGRGIARFQMGDSKTALVDVDRAAGLFEQQGDKTSAESTQKLAQEIRKPLKEPKGGSGLGSAMLGLAGTLLKLFVGI
jgi:tetratricopeptide (TPR) repeat protein